MPSSAVKSPFIGTSHTPESDPRVGTASNTFEVVGSLKDLYKLCLIIIYATQLVLIFIFLF
ncbi:MAG: hypothetical protein EBY89_05360 [Actinobacteria bacterium]|nr:hypothetical protein [Actinomycetota bacterium]